MVTGMKITVVGASGLIGSKVVELLRRQGHDVVAASRSTSYFGASLSRDSLVIV
jgi:uncharacterized protein YbjT (DUF2867 family)